jgi:hypothetical protein
MSTITVWPICSDEVLQQAGFTVQGHPRERGAWQRRTGPALILLDVNLPI